MDVVLSLARTYVQMGVGALFAYLVGLGLKLPADWPAAAETVAWALLVALAVAGVRWLETRKGDGFLAVLARRVAVVLTAGLSKQQPVYAPAGRQVWEVGAKPDDARRLQ